ncbi:ABC transporter permease [Anaerocolumna xylanovorans]|uniref:ABC-2 type transport system permease protein n=1 Tax=Anaerocolumna xylanovorans DSM 12503 TaxID=1121345 RepID=A0A1M7Y7C0_9FIRM|nr:ABC transporter permease [Anaerocolumna xylanovorans]SHO48408.1 ABC-2 type transport system permease protein [Anaerocolumna xylanovorans DSM 12503]
MKIFQVFFKTLKKRSVSVIIYFMIFLALSVLMSGNGKKQTEAVYKDAKVKVAVLDRDNSVLSKSLYDYLSNTQKIVEIKDDKQSISDELFYQNVEYVLIIKKGFEEGIKTGKYEDIVENVKVPQSISGKLLDSKIDQYLSELSTYMAAGFSAEEAAKNTLKNSEITADVKLYKVQGASEEKSSAYYYYLYIPYVLIGMLMTGVGSILLIFRKKDLDWRIKCSSMPELRKNSILLLACGVFSFVCWAVFVLLSLLLYRTDILTGKGALFILNSLVFLLVAMSLIYMVSFLVKTLNAMNMAANVISLGLSFLGGIFVPLEYMSKSVVQFSKVLPTYWYVVNNEAIDSFVNTTKQYHTILRNFGIELIFAVLFFVIALYLSKSRAIAQHG